MVELKDIDPKEVLITGFSVVGAIFILCFLILFGWFLIWKLFLVRFSFIRELVYGSDETISKKSQRTSISTSTMQETHQTPLRRSSRLRERQSKNQHGE